jgi:hypothetical protein
MTMTDLTVRLAGTLRQDLNLCWCQLLGQLLAIPTTTSSRLWVNRELTTFSDSPAVTKNDVATALWEENTVTVTTLQSKPDLGSQMSRLWVTA